MTITMSDSLQSFLTAIKDLHSTILYMILKKTFWRVEDWSCIKSWGEVANFGINFSANLWCKQNHAIANNVFINIDCESNKHANRNSKKKSEIVIFFYTNKFNLRWSFKLSERPQTRDTSRDDHGISLDILASSLVKTHKLYQKFGL